MGKINQEIAQEIIDSYLNGDSTQELAKRYNLWQTTICNLIRGQSWKQCKRPDDILQIVKDRIQNSLFKKGRKCHIDVPPLTSFQEDIIIGSLLGDGSINKGSVNCRFSKKQCLKFKEYTYWHEDVLYPYSSKISNVFSREKLVGGRKGLIKERIKIDRLLVGHDFYTHQHPIFNDFRAKWYNGKIKIIPNDLELNEQRIAIWFWDDGSNDYDNRAATICTQSFTMEEAAFLRDKLMDFDIEPSIGKVISQYTGREMPLLKFYSKSYDDLIALVKPYCLWGCMSHKVKWKKALEAWEYSGKFSLDEAQHVIELRKKIPAKEIAKIYGVHVNTIYAMISGRSWKHLSRSNK